MAIYKKPAAPKKPTASAPPRPQGVKDYIRSNGGLSFLKGPMRPTSGDKPLTAKEKAAGDKRGLKAANKPTPKKPSTSKVKSTPRVGRGGGGLRGVRGGNLGGGGMNWQNK